MFSIYKWDTVPLNSTTKPLRISKQMFLQSMITGESFPSDEGVFCIMNSGDFAVLPRSTAEALAKKGKLTFAKK